MTQQHTPAPWNLDADNRIQSDSAQYPIGQIFDLCLPDEEVEANKNLILAAPELLQCLEDFYHFIERANPRAGQLVWRAIKKAKGGAS